MIRLNINKLSDIKLDRMKKETLMLIAIVFILLVFLYFQLFLKGKTAEFFGTLTEIRKVKSDIKNTIEDLKYKDILKNRFKNMEGKIIEYEKKLPTESDLPMLLADLSNMAKDSYVKILGISPLSTTRRRYADEKKKRIYREIPIMINARSGYHELGSFINKLEMADRFMEVSNIKIKANPSSIKRHDAELIVSTYVLLQE